MPRSRNNLNRTDGMNNLPCEDGMKIIRRWSTLIVGIGNRDVVLVLVRRGIHLYFGA